MDNFTVKEEIHLTHNLIAILILIVIFPKNSDVMMFGAHQLNLNLLMLCQ